MGKKTTDIRLDETEKIMVPVNTEPERSTSDDITSEFDLLSEMEDGLSSIAEDYPSLAEKSNQAETRTADLKAILDISQTINSSLVLDDILQKVMKYAIELLQAERGFLMLLDEAGELQFKTVHNISREVLHQEDFKISNSIANDVARNGISIYTSDAQADEKYSKQKSIAELNLRSIMCVPLKIKDKIIGVVYLDNSTEAKIFLQSDLYLFELLAEQASTAIENAKLYENLLGLKRYNENVVNKTPVGIVVINKDLDIMSLNDAAFRILTPADKQNEAHRQTSRNAMYLNLVCDESRKYWKRNIEDAFEGGKAFEDPRYYYKLPNENEKVLSIKISPLEIEPHNTQGLIIAIEDITEKMMLENYVMLSEKLVAKGEMAASIGHELNNHLAIISNSAELMMRNIARKKYDKLDNNAEAIVSNISTIKRFTDGLMDFSRLEKEVVYYELRKLIEDLLFSIKPQKALRNIKFDVKIPHGLPQVQIDVGQIQQVLLNCIYNSADAIKSVPDLAGKISIKAELTGPDQQTVILELSDNGPGIDAESMQKIFEPGFTTKPDGHGLGLVNCKRIIENHHGSIEISSEPGVATTFTIKLPVNQPKTDK